MEALTSRWYAFVPWLLVILVVWRQHGWRRAFPVALGGWLIAFAAEWGSTVGPGVPFGVYAYRSVGLLHDWRLLGVPLFDSLSFTWLAYCTYSLCGWLGARGGRRLVLGALAMVAIDVVVDPVALRGARWWLGSIYSYPAHSALWYGVSALNYLGWLVVGLALQLWLGLWLGDRGREGPSALVLSAVLVAGVVAQSAVLAIVLGIGPSALLAVVLLASIGIASRGLRSPAPSPGRPLVVVACALGSEARAVRRSLGRGWVGRPVAGFLRWSRSSWPAVEVWETGMGPVAAAAAAASAPAGATILVAGVGGACSTGWTVGSLAVGSSVLAGSGDWLELDPAAQKRLLETLVVRSAQLVSLEQPVDSEAEREALALRGVDVAEMETEAWLTHRNHPELSPVAALRVVTDTPSQPIGVAASLIPPGAAAPSPLRVANLILFHPGRLGQLIKLGQRQRLALGALGKAVALAVPVLEKLSQNRAGWVSDGHSEGRAAIPAS